LKKGPKKYRFVPFFETIELLKYLWKRNLETVDKFQYRDERLLNEVERLRSALMAVRPFIYGAKTDKRSTKLLKEINSALSHKFISFARWKKRKKTNADS